MKNLCNVFLSVILRVIKSPNVVRCQQKELKKPFKALILAPHSDDEVVGCFHLLEQEAYDNEFSVAIVTHERSDGGFSGDRFQETKKALSSFRLKKIENWDFEDGCLDGSLESLRRKISDCGLAYDYIFVTPPNDKTPDHRSLGAVAMETIPHDKLIFYRSTWWPFHLKDADFFYFGDPSVKIKTLISFTSQSHISLKRCVYYSLWESDSLYCNGRYSVEAFQFASTDKLSSKMFNTISLKSILKLWSWK